MRRLSLLTALALGTTLLSSCGGGVVKMNWETYQGEAIEIAVGEKFEVELASNRMVSRDPDAFEWVILDTGVLQLVDEEQGTRSEDPEEFAGGFSRYTVFTFEAASVGTADLVFSYSPAGTAQRVNIQRIPIITTE